LTAALKRLRWQCRRGVKELDVVLYAYLERDYAKASTLEQQLFVELLAFEDDRLLAYFFSGDLPESDELRTLVRKIRTAFVA